MDKNNLKYKTIQDKGIEGLDDEALNQVVGGISDVNIPYYTIELDKTKDVNKIALVQGGICPNHRGMPHDKCLVIVSDTEYRCDCCECFWVIK